MMASLSRRLAAAERAAARLRSNQAYDFAGVSDHALVLLERCFRDDGEYIGASNLSDAEAEIAADGFVSMGAMPDYRAQGMSAREALDRARKESPLL